MSTENSQLLSLAGLSNVKLLLTVVLELKFRSNSPKAQSADPTLELSLQTAVSFSSEQPNHISISRSRYVDSYTGGAPIRFQIYREQLPIGLLERHTIQKAKALVAIMDSSRLRFFALSASTFSKATITELQPTLCICLSTVLPASFMADCFFLERVDFKLGGLDLWIGGQTIHDVEGNEIQNTSKGVEESCKGLLVDQRVEPEAEEVGKPKHSSTGRKKRKSILEVFWVGITDNLRGLRVTRCVLQDLVGIRQESEFHLGNMVRMLKITRNKGMLAMLHTKGSSTSIALLLDETELAETSQLKLSTVYSVLEAETLSNPIHPDSSIDPNAVAFMAAESLKCYDLKQIIDCAAQTLLEGTSEENCDIGKFVSRLSSRSREFAFSSVNPTLSKIAPPGPVKPIRDSLIGTKLEAYQLIVSPVHLIRETLQGLLYLEDYATLSATITAKVPSSSILSLTIPNSYVNPEIAKIASSALTEAKKHLSDFKQYATNELKSLLQKQTELMPVHAEQLWIEVETARKTGDVMIRLQERIKKIKERNKRISSLKSKVHEHLLGLQSHESDSFFDMETEVNLRRRAMEEKEGHLRKVLSSIKGAKSTLCKLSGRLEQLNMDPKLAARMLVAVREAESALVAARGTTAAPNKSFQSK